MKPVASLCVLVLSLAFCRADAPEAIATDDDPSPPVSGLHKATELRGVTVKNIRGDSLGTIRDAAIHLERGELLYLVMASGGFLGIGERLHALPPQVLSAGADRRVLLLRASPARLRAQPAFDNDNWPSTPPLWPREDLETADTFPQPRPPNEQDEPGAEIPQQDAAEAWEPAGAERPSRPGETGPAQPAREIIGMTVRNLEDQTLGTIKDLALNLESGGILYVVLAHGGLLGVGEKWIAIPPEAFSRPPDERRQLRLNATLEMLEQAEGFDPRRWPDAPDRVWGTEPYRFHGQEGAAIDDPAGAAPPDREITRQIRRTLVADNTLSLTARNIAIHTSDGAVTLRGVVQDAEERDAVVEKVKNLPAVRNIDVQLEVRKNPAPGDDDRDATAP